MLKDVAKAPGRILARHSEHADRVPQGARAGKRLQPAWRHKIDPSTQQIRQVKPDLRNAMMPTSGSSSTMMSMSLSGRSSPRAAEPNTDACAIPRRRRSSAWLRSVATIGSSCVMLQS